MAVDVEIDVDLLKNEIKKTYASVSQEPERDFIFPTGRAWAEDLRYPPELANVPDTAVESFAGVANPWELGRLTQGERVLDLGSGAGTDSLVAAQMVPQIRSGRVGWALVLLALAWLCSAGRAPRLQDLASSPLNLVQAHLFLGAVLLLAVTATRVFRRDPPGHSPRLT